MKRVENIRSMVSITKLPSISKSVSFYEPRFVEYEDYSTRFFPDIKDINTMKFSYE
ncbi:hypothetical protein N9W00_01015 [Arcobacteraceae bacterium]|nr:hypothetical protein [Arcobacteraceae bacterium]